MADLKIRPARGVPADWVEMKHSVHGGVQRCHPSAVAHWEARGWVKTEHKTAPSPTPRAGQEG